jgi:hypothetical protein
MPSLTPIRIGLHPSLLPWAAEVKYVFRTLTRIAGFPYEFRWINRGDDHQAVDVYYGPKPEDSTASVTIPACGRHFSSASWSEPQGLADDNGVPVLEFHADPTNHARCRGGTGLSFSEDVIYGCFWLLIGAREPHYSRDRWDNLHLDGSSFLRLNLQSKPLVSMYGTMLRDHFRRQGRTHLTPPWSQLGDRLAVALTHDVDYPEIIRWVECLRLLASRRHKGLRLAGQVLRGNSNFWKFPEWMAFAKELGGRSAFYFMARQGSLLQYARGTPDAFYDVRTPAFRSLLEQMKEEGFEVGLHASFNAYRDSDQLAREKQLIEEVAGGTVDGNRHHFWHMDPTAPHETMQKHEAVGLKYDSSLAFELYPGFRRGICHPFRPFHPVQRRELRLVQLPPAWMDDHYDRRLAYNKIEDAVTYAKTLADLTRTTGGALVLDYHVRGMNADFYPRYGPWLRDFLHHHSGPVSLVTPAELARQYTAYEGELEAASADRATFEEQHAVEVPPEADFEISPLRPDEVPAVARMHFQFFGMGEMHGSSLANLGLDFLEKVFYGLNLDNPYFFADVARYRGEMIGFSVYSSDWQRLSRHTIVKHFGSLSFNLARVALCHPLKFSTHVLGNLRFITESIPKPIRDIRGWYMLLGVKGEFRSREFRQRTGIWVNGKLWDQMVRTLRNQGCDALWAAPGAHNGPINQFFIKQGAELVAQAKVQGLLSNFYRQPLNPQSAAI